MTMNWSKLLCKDRPRKSTSPGDHREEFERDLDRTTFSTPVKRLQDKAQVFPLDPHDAVRTRLTHSLEVSAVARGLGIKIGQWLIENNHINIGMERQIEAIVTTCGLVHDLGNPPFGHSGEDAIRHWFTTRFDDNKLRNLLEDNNQLVQDFLLFEGNAQSLRLLTRLQILADFNGLNLTYGTLSASCKYISPSHESGKEVDHAKSKPGYFASENGVIKDIREHTGTGGARNPLTYLVEVADDAVYSVADIEDAVKKGIVKWSEVEKELAGKNDPVINSALEIKDKILMAGNGAIQDELSGDVNASAFRTAVIGLTVNAAVLAFQKHYNDIMNGLYRGELVKDCEAATLIKSLKLIGKSKVYCTPSNLKLELMGRHVICDLMDIFWEGASDLPVAGKPASRTFSGKAGALLSENYRSVFQHSLATKSKTKLPEQYHRLQLVTDYVCGMTDTFATRLHSELTNG